MGPNTVYTYIRRWVHGTLLHCRIWRGNHVLLFYLWHVVAGSWFPAISDWSSPPSCRNPPICPSNCSILGTSLCKPPSLAALGRRLGPLRRKFLSPVRTPNSTECFETPLALFSGICPSSFLILGVACAWGVPRSIQYHMLALAPPLVWRAALLFPERYVSCR